MKIQILGTGCPKCKKLFELTDKVAKDLKLNYELFKITDMNEIVSFGVMLTPALAIDGVVKISGRVPSFDELKKILKI